MNVNDYSLWTAMITPFLETGEVDYECLKTLLKEQADAKNAILILGSTGEALNIGIDERKKILEFAISQKLNVPIMAGVGGVNLKQTSEWVSYLETLDIHAYLMVTPLYAKPGDHGQYEWFRALMDLSTRPVMLYNVPGRTGASLSYFAVEKLKDHPQFWAIKEASGSVFDFRRYKETAPSAKIFSGDDVMTPAFCSMGAVGLVSVAANVWPFETHEYVRQSLNESLQDGELWKECSDTLFIASNPIPVKALVHHLGRINSKVLRPPLDDRDLKDIRPLAIAHKSITSWYQAQK